MIFVTIQMNDGLADHRTADGVNAAVRIHRVKAQRAEDIPRRHLAAIHVAALAGGRVVIHRGHDLPHVLLGFVRRAGVIVKIRHMMTLLIPLRVLADQAADVGNGRLDRRIRREQGIQLSE